MVPQHDSPEVKRVDHHDADPLTWFVVTISKIHDRYMILHISKYNICIHRFTDLYIYRHIYIWVMHLKLMTLYKSPNRNLASTTWCLDSCQPLGCWSSGRAAPSKPMTKGMQAGAASTPRTVGVEIEMQQGSASTPMEPADWEDQKAYPSKMS